MNLFLMLRTVSGMNASEHWRVRAKRVKAEREIVGFALIGREKPTLPCVVKITRIAPSTGLDPFDNLPSALKGCVDAIAEWLGVDDKRSDRVRYECAQERGKGYGVRIEVAAPFCYCERVGLGAAGVSCGDCPRDYK